MDRCETKECCGKAALQGGPITLPGTDGHTGPWKLYNHLIAGIPADILVTDCCLGTHWSYVEAECGMGVSYTLTGGGRPAYSGVLSGLPLSAVAELSKSWNFREATLGVAALNAWYSQEEKVLALGGRIDEGSKQEGIALPGAELPGSKKPSLLDSERVIDPFVGLRDEYTGKKVTVIGHFPGVEAMSEICELTVLERNPRSALDTPDPACEYLLPSQDFVFLTGVTLINKTLPRLLDLAKDAICVLVGPSVIPSGFLFKWGVDLLAGRVVLDPERIKLGVKQGIGFGGALRMFALEKDCA
ncbi:MAG: DUF364 domain-containing protein [Coriobacteriales bacterium]|jgi:uncharacterized protein (DUF4213/DUF364 family)|nr:DUF364 domain-containing protein [Coriobacteriales bacterium]